MALVLLRAVLRSNELFVVSIRDGRALLIPGRIPILLLKTIERRVAEQGVTRGELHAGIRCTAPILT